MARALRVILTALSSAALLALGGMSVTHAHTAGRFAGAPDPSVYSYDLALNSARSPLASAAPAIAPDGSESTRSTSLRRVSPRSNASVVAAEGAEGGAPALRQAYVDNVASISDNVAAWEKAGADPEFIAREAWADRRALGIQYKGLTPPDMLEEIYARNIAKYGDPLGLSIDWLRGQGRTWQQIIERATRTGGKDLGF